MIEWLPVIHPSATQFHLFVISSIFLLTWIWTLNPKWSFCIDDLEGVAKFSDHFVQHKDPTGKIVKEEKIDYYEQDDNGKKTRYRMFQLNPSIGFPGCVMRWFRTNWGRGYKRIGVNTKGHSIYGFVQIAWKHHLLNLIVQYSNCVLAYLFLSQVFGANLAFYTVLLFSAHPVSVQVTGWISGVNYSLSMLGTLIALNLSLHITNLHYLIPSISLISSFSVMMLLPGAFTWVPLLMLGKINSAIIYFIAGGLVLVWQASIVIKYRSKAFIEQKMGKSTTIYFRKIFVVVKTFWYYLKMIIFPKRLGLFHTWGYHFEDPINYFDRKFLFGLASLIGIGIWYYFAPFTVKFGLVWFFVYLLIFSNIMTAMQMVTERYAYYPSLGFCIILSYYLQNQPVFIAFILGIYIMRVWAFLPTFENEVRFYESNVQNFPDSEVAMGNLGVAYLNHGMPHKAMDTWLEATRQNPLYDVPWYNLYSIMKQNGDIISARNFMKKCLDSNTLHFPDQWQKEYNELETMIAQAISAGHIQVVPQPPPIPLPPPTT